MDFIALASKVHPTIWGVLIGSSITLLGTFRQGRTALKLLLKQKALENKNEKEKRDFELKKESYLNSLKIMTKLMNVFVEFTKPGRGFDNFVKEVQELFVDLCIVDLVAAKKTLEPMHNFQKYYFQVIMDLMNEKIPYEALVIDKNTKRDWYDYYSKKIEENTALINNNTHNGTETEDEYHSFLCENYLEYCENRDRYSKELNELAQKLLTAELIFKRKAIEKILMLNQFLTEFVQAARTDLGLETFPIEFSQVNAFHQCVRDTTEKIFAAVTELNKEEARED